MQLHLIVADESAVALPVRLHYRAHEPYAVSAEFCTGDRDSVTWVFARDLVDGGMRGPVGEGDVRVWPAAGRPCTRAGDTVYLSLSSPDGQALLEASAGELSAFLARTHSVVPAGTESRHLDIDATIDALLSA